MNFEEPRPDLAGILEIRADGHPIMHPTTTNRDDQ